MKSDRFTDAPITCLTASAFAGKAQACGTECYCDSLGVRRELKDHLNRSFRQLFTTEAVD